jgi:hypothetical protein
MQSALQAQIDAGWQLLVLTTHHDFVAGTACDVVYYSGGNCGNSNCKVPDPPPGGVLDSKGQLSMSNQTVVLANDAMSTAMNQLSTVAGWTPQPNVVPVAVFNQLGLDLPNTAIVEMDDPSGGKVGYQVVVNGTIGPVQRSWDGKLLFQVPGMNSMSYTVVVLQPLPTVPNPFPPQSINSSTYIFSNGAVNLTLAQDAGWAIANLTIGSSWYVQPGAPANQIGLWRDDGNLYQFGI